MNCVGLYRTLLDLVGFGRVRSEWIGLDWDGLNIVFMGGLGGGVGEGSNKFVKALICPS